MGDLKPAAILLRPRELTVLRRVLKAALPQEGCALVLGAAAGDPAAPDWEIRLIWPCLNVWDPAAERRRRFRLDPREQLLAQRWGRSRGVQVLGSAHSPPCSPAVPSATDRDLALPPSLQIILSPLQNWLPACWWLERSTDSTADGAAEARPLQWRMVH
ncbi:MAG: M67 family metallopeptidase [Cyanobium sp.]